MGTLHQKKLESTRNEIVGITLITIGVLLGMSLYTHDPQDPSLSTLSALPKIQNAVGWVGAIVSDLFYQLFGFGAYLFPVFLTTIGISFLFDLKQFSLKKSLVGGGLWLISICVMAYPNTSPLPVSYRSGGGMVGALFSYLFFNYFSVAGTQVIVYVLPLIGSLLIIPFSLRTFLVQSFYFSKRIWTAWVTRWEAHAVLVQKERVPLPVQPNTPPPSIARPQVLKLPPIPSHNEVVVTVEARPGAYRLPPLSTLSDPVASLHRPDEAEWIAMSKTLETKLLDFNVEGKITEVHPGPVVTMFEFEPAPGIKLSQITTLADDLTLAMRGVPVRIVSPIFGKAVVGLEIPNKNRESVLLKEILGSPAFDSTPSRLCLALGKDIFGAPVTANLVGMPHLLIAGSTGSGKSVGLNGIILSILCSARPDEVKILMIDPKMLEFSLYDGIPHLIAPVVVRPKVASLLLKKMVDEMERRYEQMAKTGVRNIEAYNQWFAKEGKKKEVLENDQHDGPLPYIVILIDELADLMMTSSRDVEESIVRLAQKARACGMHLILATQRPSVDVITGIIKANFSARIAYRVASKVDARTILDTQGAERLLGKGDMLYLSPTTGTLQRIHGAYVSEEEVKRVVHFIKQQAAPRYDTSLTAVETAESSSNEERDEAYEQAREIVITNGQASASFLQRKMRVGYPRAARMIEMMEEDGLLGPANGGKPREILIRKENE